MLFLLLISIHYNLKPPCFIFFLWSTARNKSLILLSENICEIQHAHLEFRRLHTNKSGSNILISLYFSDCLHISRFTVSSSGNQLLIVDDSHLKYPITPFSSLVIRECVSPWTPWSGVSWSSYKNSESTPDHTLCMHISSFTATYYY